MEQTKYDVFISYSRKDYVSNDQVILDNPISVMMEYFDKNGISYWLDKKGIYSGQEYIERITEAIDKSKMLVFVSSKNSNESGWTMNEILEAYDEKKLIIPFKIDASEYNKKYKIILRPCDHIEYYNQPKSAFAQLLNAITQEKEKIILKEQEDEAQTQKTKTISELQAKITEFYSLTGRRHYLRRNLYTKSNDMGLRDKLCPVCGQKSQLEASFCPECSWHFNSLDGVYGVDNRSLYDDTQVSIAQKLYAQAKEAANDKNRIEEMAKTLEEEQCKITTLESQLKEKKEKLGGMEKTNQELNQQLGENKKLIENLKAQLKDTQALYAEEKKKVEEQIRRDEEQRLAEQRRMEEEANAPERIFEVDGVDFKMIRVACNPSQNESIDNVKEDYFIGEIPVTQVQWKAVMKEKKNPSKFNGDNRPVDNVSWKDCQDFIRELNSVTHQQFCLPSETQWEVAAKGGMKSKGFKYAGSDNIKEVAWFKANSKETTHPVREKKANELELFDMCGNVWEWCQDSVMSQENTTGNGAGTSHVLRGGCCYSDPKSCTLSSRLVSDSRSSSFGFRLVLNINKDKS